MPSRCLLALALAVLAALPARAQSSDPTPYFTFEVVELARTEVPALHSAAWAQHDGLWLFVTGRTDGLHPLVPGVEAFPAEFAHGAFVVYDPVGDQRWTASLDALPDAMADPLRSTNAQFFQEGTTLYVVGGYGVDSATGEKTTFGTLTAIDVPGMISAVRTAGPLEEHLRRLDDDALAVTGGLMARIPGTARTYGLFGGHFYAGEYLTASEVQEYTDAVRFFDIEDDGTTLALTNPAEVTDPALLHRRDGNIGGTVVPGTEALGLGLYGGVFTPSTLPYRTPLSIEGTTITEHPFEAKFGHYTTATVPIYDRDARSMHTVFLGGMGQFFVSEENGASCVPEREFFVCQDNLVPFINAIVALSVAEDGTMREHVLGTLPGLLGANAAYIPVPTIPTYANDVLRLRDLPSRTRVGYMVGGLEASAPNAGWMSQPTEASNRLFVVYVRPLPAQSAANDRPTAFHVEAAAPNPFQTTTRLVVVLDAPGPLTAEVFDLVGRHVATLHDGPLGAGPHTFTVNGADWPSGVYVARVTGERGTATQRLVRLR